MKIQNFNRDFDPKENNLSVLNLICWLGPTWILSFKHKPVKVYLHCVVWLCFNHPLAVQRVFVKGGPTRRQQNAGGGSEMASTRSCTQTNTHSHKEKEIYLIFFFFSLASVKAQVPRMEFANFWQLLHVLELCNPFRSFQISYQNMYLEKTLCCERQSFFFLLSWRKMLKRILFRRSEREQRQKNDKPYPDTPDGEKKSKWKKQLSLCSFSAGGWNFVTLIYSPVRVPKFKLKREWASF